MARTGHRFAYFDVANTLMEKRGLIETIGSVFAEIGIAFPAKVLQERHKTLSEVIQFPDRTDRAFYNGFNASFCLAMGVLPTAALLEALYTRCNALPWVAYDDVGALDGLRIPLGILSNWDTSLETKLVKGIPIASPFDRVIGSQAVGAAKPNKTIFELALSGLRCDPSEVLFVGDSLRLDIAPALSLGIDAVLLDRANMFPAYQGRRINNLWELAALVEVNSK